MSDVLISVEGKVGRIRLNRPKAIHALNTGMCAAILDALAAWRSDTAVEAVMIDHAEGRGFCAGGDIRMLATSGADDGAAARDFFRVEYQMNHALFTFVKPIIAFMDGITMGGGVGLAMPAKFRVATEHTRFAMPETGIGLFPDVGGGWYLSRLPHRVGQYMALTGYRAGPGECLDLGLATHFVATEDLELLKALILKHPRDLEQWLDDKGGGAGRPALMDHYEDIERLFASDRLEDIIAALEADPGDWSMQQRATLAGKSPQSMKVSLKLLLDGATMPTFEDEMRQEYAVATRVVQRHDFIEGVRALIIDKDNHPRWDPATPDGVSDHLIDQIFAPLPDAEAWNPA